jgi:hypothetical protein
LAATEIPGEQPKGYSVSHIGVHREFPVATGNSGDSIGTAGAFADFAVTSFDSFFKVIFSLFSNGCVWVDMAGIYGVGHPQRAH